MRSFLFRALLCLLGLTLSLHATAPAQTQNPLLLKRPWTAAWIGHPTASLLDYGVFHYRKKITLPTKPERFIVHVTADNRYRLYVNGQSVAVGPARGDPLHWHFESLDLAPYLRAGENTFAAVVWNQGLEKPYAQMTEKTGFLLKGDTDAESFIETNNSWKVYQNPAYTAIPSPGQRLRTYLVVGASEHFDASKYPWGWEQPEFDDSRWPNAKGLGLGYPRGTGSGSAWYLVPRTIPLPEETPERLAAVRRAEGATPPEGWLKGKAPWTIAANQTVTVLLDNGHETTAYPELVFSGGRDSSIEIVYAEALIDENRQKGNRNEIEGKTLHGYLDRIIPGGESQRVYSPLWYRTYRYVELRIQTKDTPLVLEDLRARFTAYPFEEKGKFESSDEGIAQIWNVGWRTARLCAFETYMDCPYYEQLQYVADTRIQALVSLYAAGDHRLMRHSIELYDRSRIPDGLVQSRFPSSDLQIINTFSLFWVSMVHDYWRHCDDPAFVKRMLSGTRGTLDWFADRIDPETGLLGPLEWWSFVDWPNEWRSDPVSHVGGVPAGASAGGSAIITLQYAITLREGADLEEAFGNAHTAQTYRDRADRLVSAVRERCWDPEKRYFSDTPEKKSFSQHANTFAVLADVVSGAEATDLVDRMMADTTLIQSTYYFDFYVLRAMKHVGLGNRYVGELKPWREMLDQGLTTFAERQDPTRSDCHAWSASPNYELLATVCGIEPASAGFKTVRIAPHPGPLNEFRGSVPHPDGPITLVFRNEGNTGTAEISLPADLTGEFVWNGKTHPIKGGLQTIRW